MTEPFKPAGAESKWAPLYRLLKSGDVNQVFSYEELSAAAGRDILADRSPLYKAIEHLQRNDHRTAEVERGVGYRIIEAREHYSVGLKHGAKARRSTRRGRIKVQAADRSQLSQAERERQDALGAIMAKHEGQLRGLDKRVSRLEAATVGVQKRQASTDIKVEKLTAEQERLAALLKQMGYAPQLVAE